MCRGLISRALVVMYVLTVLAFARDDGPGPVFTGTLNIVLANGNGIVVLTDSNQTEHLQNGEFFTSPLPGRKLFQIDDKTVCTIAGFGAISLPRFPEFESNAAGVLDRYAAELRGAGGVRSFREKLMMLRFLFEFQLTGIGNLQHLRPEQLRDYGFVLILAGYDSDGTAKIGRVVLSANLLPDGTFSPITEELTETAVGKELAHETAGIGGPDVETILAHPALWAEEPEIARYAASKKLDRGSSLTVQELEALAKLMARHSELDNAVRYLVPGTIFNFRTFWPVGGRNQIAVLERSSIQKLDQPLFEERSSSIRPFGIVLDVTLTDESPSSPLIKFTDPGVISLYLKSHFIRGTINLDDAYYFEDDFTDATLQYYGGVLSFDPSNRLTNCILILGPHVNRKSQAVEELIARFPWRTVH